MLLKNASRKTGLQQFLIILLALFALIKLFFEEKDVASIGNFISLFGNSFVEIYDKYFIFIKLITYIFYIGNAIILIYILRKHKLIELHKYYPAFFYVLFFLVFLKSTLLIPLFINTLILLFLLPTFLIISEKNYKQQYGFIFGLFCGLIMLIYAPFLFFFLLIYLVLIINGFYDWKNYIMPLLGLLITYIYFFSTLYLFDYKSYTYLFYFYFDQFTFLPFHFACINPFQIIIYSCIFVFYVLFSYLLFSKASKMNIFIRKKYYFLLLGSLFGLFFSFLLIDYQYIGILFFISILSAMGGICESLIKKRIFYNILIFIFIIAILLDYFSRYFYA